MLSVYFTTVVQKTFLNVFYSAMLEFVLALVVSGAGSVLPQLFPGCSWVIPGGLCCLALVLPDHAGRRGFIDSRWRSVPDRLEVPGMVTGRGENTKKMYDNSKTASKPGRFELEKFEKNRRNLKLIQTCDFLFCAFCIEFSITYLGAM